MRGHIAQTGKYKGHMVRCMAQPGNCRLKMAGTASGQVLHGDFRTIDNMSQYNMLSKHLGSLDREGQYAAGKFMESLRTNGPLVDDDRLESLFAKTTTNVSSENINEDLVIHKKVNVKRPLGHKDSFTSIRGGTRLEGRAKKVLKQYDDDPKAVLNDIPCAFNDSPNFGNAGATEEGMAVDANWHGKEGDGWYDHGVRRDVSVNKNGKRSDFTHVSMLYQDNMSDNQTYANSCSVKMDLATANAKNAAAKAKAIYDNDKAIIKKSGYGNGSDSSISINHNREYTTINISKPRGNLYAEWSYHKLNEATIFNQDTRDSNSMSLEDFSRYSRLSMADLKTIAEEY